MEVGSIKDDEGAAYRLHTAGSEGHRDKEGWSEMHRVLVVAGYC